MVSQEILNILGFLIIVPALGRYLIRKAKHSTAIISEGAIQLRYPPMYFWIGLSSIILILGCDYCLFQMHLSTSNADVMMGCLVTLLFVAIGGSLMWLTKRFMIDISDKGIACQKSFGRPSHIFIAWNDIVEISYTTNFVIFSKDGKKIYVGISLNGIQQFLEACERRLPIASLEKARGGYRILGRSFPEKN